MATTSTELRTHYSVFYFSSRFDSPESLLFGIPLAWFNKLGFYPIKCSLKTTTKGHNIEDPARRGFRICVSLSCVGVQQLGARSKAKESNGHYTKAGHHSPVSSIVVTVLFWMALPGDGNRRPSTGTNGPLLNHEFTLLFCSANRKFDSHSSVADVLLSLNKLRIQCNKKHLQANRQCRGRVLRDGCYGLDFHCTDRLADQLNRNGLPKNVDEYVEVNAEDLPIVYRGRVTPQDEAKLSVLRFYGLKMAERLAPAKIFKDLEKLRAVHGNGMNTVLEMSHFKDPAFSEINEELKNMVLRGSRARVRQALFRLGVPNLWPKENDSE